MREKIILAPGANGSELIKSLAMHGVNTFGLRIMGSGELARMALMRSGISISERFLSAKEECTVMALLVSGDEYFGRTKYSDVQEIAKAVRTIRSLVTGEDEIGQIRSILSGGIFTEKNEALIRACEKYINYLSSEGYVDSVSITRRASLICDVINADMYALNEYPLTPLECSLLDRLSGGTYKEISITSLFEGSDKPVSIESIRNCYGASNEVGMIIDDIYRDKKMDKCTVAVTDAGTYTQLFLDYSLLYDLPVTFGCGIPIINSNPGRLLSVYYHWMTAGYFGESAIRALLFSAAFNKGVLSEELGEDVPWTQFYRDLGTLRLTNDLEMNEERIDEYRNALLEEKKLLSEGNKEYDKLMNRIACVPYLEIMGRELALNVEDFIRKYSYMRVGDETNADELMMKLDKVALDTIYSELSSVRESGEHASEDIITNVLRMNALRQSSEAGKLHVTDIKGTLCTVRENVYVAGLSATKYPGSPKENYLLLDADIALFGKGAEYLVSENRIKSKSEMLRTLSHLAAKVGSKLYLSYAGLNVAELKKENASSMIFDLYGEANGKNASIKDLEKSIIKVEYFEPAISKSREIGKAYIEGQVVLPLNVHGFGEFVEGAFQEEYAPTSIEQYLACNKQYLYANIFKLNPYRDENPFEVMSGADRGTLAHALMEELANSSISKEEFLDMAKEYFDRQIKEKPPVIPDKIDEEKNQFLEMMEYAYDTDPHREVIMKEEEIHASDEILRLNVFGIPDRVEKLDDGTYMIVDYKTARKVTHHAEHPETCIQILTYAYLVESLGHKVSMCEYRYLQAKKVVQIPFEENRKTNLDYYLAEFRQGINNGHFRECRKQDDIEGEDTTCTFCGYRYVCPKERRGKDEDE